MARDPAAAPPPGRRTDVLLVHNAFTHDSRVLNEARGLAGLGDRVVVVAAAGRDLPAHAIRDGIEIHRFGFDPPDTRAWRNRSRVSRPWRFRRELAGWVRRRLAGRPSERAAAAAGIAGAIVILPWVGLTIAYHYGGRAIDRLARVLGRRPPSPILGGWIEGRARSVLFAAHRPLRLRDWGRRVTAAVEDGTLPRATIWHANDLETLPLALGLRERFGGRVVYDSHELFLEAAGRARLGPLKRRVLRAAERRWVARVDGAVTVNAALAAELARRDGLDPVVVRNCPPAWRPAPGFVSPLRAAVADHGLDPDWPIVIAHGGFQVHRGFEELLAAAEPLTRVGIVFLGYGALGDRFRAIAASDPWRGRLAVLPAVSPDELLGWLAGADIAACLIQPTTLNHRLSTPNKMFEAIAAGLPLLAADLPAIGPIVREWGVGRLVDPADIGAIRAGLEELLARPDLRAELADRARAAAAAELNWEHEFAALAALYAKVDGRGAPGGTA